MPSRYSMSRYASGRYGQSRFAPPRQAVMGDNSRVAYDAAVLAYYDEVTAEPPRWHMGALNTLVTGLKASSTVSGTLWSDTLLLGLHVNFDRQAARVNLKTPSIVATESGFTTADEWQAEEGFQGDASNNVLDWGLNFTELGATNTDFSVMVWSFTDTNVNAQSDVGVAGSNDIRVNGRSAGGAMILSSSEATGYLPIVADSLGFYGFDRPDGSNVRAVKNGAFLGTAGRAVSAFPAGDIQTLSGNGAETSRIIGITWIGNSLTEAEHASLYSLIGDYIAAVEAAYAPL